ncbi:hypothetical protein [Pedobacter rhodius]|uniref:Uncharacterized protein n=1 Tax=Pedobacter rhodius TaxID=3004098 RepID=A0ABT4KXH6_9SPHI|nr:hypothetical protein [Pedobacter sp. SJ11]MCZ4223631.1 hypothetical protein [Pedobacter sp. SJ11]
MEGLLIYTIAFLSGAIALYLLQKLIGLIGKENKGYPNTMDVRTIHELVDNYRNNQLAAINKVLGLDDAYSVSFGLSTLKKFITDIESYSKKVDPRITDSVLGVRFYYAAYPKDTEWDNFEGEKLVGKDYAQKHTLIMIPTLKKKISSGNHLDYDFNPLDRKTFSANDRDENKQVEMMVMYAESSDKPSRQVMAQNHGQLIPPAEAGQQAY